MHSLLETLQGGGYESGADAGKRRRSTHGSSSIATSSGSLKRPSVVGFQSSEQKALRGMSHTEFSRMNCYERHHKMMQDYIKYYGGKPEDLLPKAPTNVMTDFDLLKEAYRFIPKEEDLDGSTWEKRMAKKYYDKLFKEYCIGYLSGYKEGKIGMRWRTKKEVIQGKGQFICGNVTCSNTEDLKSYEVNFAYEEGGKKKQALVKLRVCPDCAYKLNYKKIKKLKKKMSKKKESQGKKKKKKRTDPEAKLDKSSKKRK
eukprot:CAMPEP_0167745108 /NCGR_PEP_ID=MMETSP0110_2-20121227/2967_1 /TAXON_ID=629695 /ORGANISM="Gymnochlora sp., Strain CCMP2014" /LENGTH=256 /DNA_ID=CAMNT_0007629711 /DNA_START=78 /DNA_END=845 /DNA_ORIENTATION=+